MTAGAAGAQAWRREPLEAVANGGTFTDGDWILKEDLASGKDVRLIQLGDIGIGAFLDKSNKWISGARCKELGCTLLEPGDVIVSRMAEPIARACIVPELQHPAITAVDVTIIRVDETVADRRFVMHFLNSPQTKVAAEALASGTTRKRITRKKLSQILIPLPPVEEQREVADAIELGLDRIEQVAATIAEARSNHRRLIASTVFRAFEGRDVKTLRLADVAGVVSGPAKGRKAKQPTREVPFLRAANVQAGRLNLEEISTYPATEAEINRYRLEKGDVLFVEGSGSRSRLGKGWLIDQPEPDTIHQNHVFRARADRSIIEPRYLAWFLQSHQAASYFNTVAKTTSGLNTLSRANAIELPVPVPDLPTQRETIRALESAIGAAQRLGLAMDQVGELVRHARTAVLGAYLGSGDRLSKVVATTSLTQNMRLGAGGRAR